MIIIIEKEFSPQDIAIKDDAIHKKRIFGRVETWYYDAVFSNNYSMAIVVNFINLGYLSFVLSGLCIYKDSKLIKEIDLRTTHKNFFGSEEKPDIKLKGQQIIKGEIDIDIKKWVYNISMKDKKEGIDLKFIKTKKAWQGTTFLGNWLVIPRFEVSGKIFLNGSTIDVSGNGYHDHNIYSLFAPLLNKGYHFGKFSVDSIDITWASVKKSRNKQQLLVIMNNDQEYISINPNNITYTINKKIENHGKIIPTKFNIKVEDKKLKLDVDIESINFHYTSIPSVNYWRYHVRNTGKIETNSIARKINDIEISEYLKFL